MKYQEFVHAIDKGQIRPLYYFYGDEPYLMDKCVQQLLERLVSADLRDFNLNVYYGTESKGDEIAETAATLPMFASWRVVVVKKADALSAASLEVLSSYIQNPSPSTCLLLQGEKIDQRKKFFTEIKKTGELVEFKRLYENQLPTFIRNEASLRGRKIEPAAAEMLVYLVGNNLQELVSELEKAILYVGEAREILVSHVRSIVSDTRVNSVFELTDALGEKKLEKALRSLGRLLNDGEAPLACPGHGYSTLSSVMEGQGTAGKTNPCTGDWKNCRDQSLFPAGDCCTGKKLFPCGASQWCLKRSFTSMGR